MNFEILMEDHVLKVILVGDSFVGKTSIIHRLVNDEFTLSTMPTVATGFYAKKVVIGQYNITLQLWDTAGQERFASLSHLFYRNTHACLLVFDMTNPKSLNSLTT